MALVGGIVALALGVLCLVLSALMNDRQDDLLGNLPDVIAALSYGLVGLVVARRQPRNSIGWILLASPVFLIVAQIGTNYSVLDYRLSHGTLPLGPLAFSLGMSLYIPWLLLVGLPIILFPEGRPPSSRWRWTLRAYLLLGALATAIEVASGVAASLRRQVVILLDGSLLLKANWDPVGSRVALVAGLAALLIWISWIVRLGFSYRASRGDRRQQLKWLLGGGVGPLLVLGAYLALPSSISNTIWFGAFLLPIGLAALPLGMGVGILRYRLYDIDRLISRAVSYALVTAVLIGVYVALVVLATRVLPFSSPIGVAAGTLAAAALFNPLRRRVQRIVDRRFNRTRYDAEQLIAQFARRLREEVDLDLVQRDLLATASRAIDPAQISIWIRERE